MTRGQSAIFIGRSLGTDINNLPASPFVDVVPKTTGYPYIVALTGEGVYSKAVNFNPTDTLTRAQMAKILVEAYDLKGNSSSEFKDVATSYWAAQYINTLVATGITTGTSPTTYGPNEPVTRNQLSVFVSRAMSYKENDGEVIAPPKPTPDGMDLSMYDSELMKNAAVESFNRVLAERKKAGLKPVKWNAEVARFAQWKAQDMSDRGYFDHSDPESLNLEDQLIKFGKKDFTNIRENIIRANYFIISEFYDAWMKSGGHRYTILFPYKNLKEEDVVADFGVGFIKAKTGEYYSVNVFIVEEENTR